jgi:hypothetical protein
MRCSSRPCSSHIRDNHLVTASVFEWSGVRNNPRRAGLLAVVLWTVFAAVVWNVVFDRIVVLAGREFVYAAYVAAAAHQPYLRIDAWMRPAIARGVRLASYAAASVLTFGCAAIALAVRHQVAMSQPRCPDGHPLASGSPGVGHGTPNVERSA